MSKSATLLELRYSYGPLPVPDLIGQNTAFNPDGTVDPDHTTDCGEACLSMVWEVATRLRLSPGCIRQAIEPTAGAGYTTAFQLSNFLHAIGIGSEVMNVGSMEVWNECSKLRHHGRYAIVLGHWLSPQTEHWRLFYEREGAHVFANDPWVPTRVQIDRGSLQSLASGTLVTVF